MRVIIVEVRFLAHDELKYSLSLYVCPDEILYI